MPLTFADYQRQAAEFEASAFSDDPTDIEERRDRFGEEALELVQAKGMSAEHAHALVDYVFGRPVGDPDIEMGGMLHCAAMLANFAGLDMAACAAFAIERAGSPEVLARIRRKRANRHGRGALPGFEADLVQNPTSHSGSAS